MEQRDLRDKPLESKISLGHIPTGGRSVSIYIYIFQPFVRLELRLMIREIILAWFACGSVVTYTRWLSPRGIVMRLIFSYSASTYFPFPIFWASWLLDFQAFTAISSDFLLSSGVSRLVTPGRWSENIILPSVSQMVTMRIFVSKPIMSWWSFW